MEVGVFDGISYSNTWGLAERGWHGVMVEPLPDFAAACREDHHNHPNVVVVESAIGAANVDSILLNLAGELSTANTELHSEYRNLHWSRPYVSNATTRVPCQTLDDMLTKCDAPSPFDLLTVDVEGFEQAVFSSFTIDHWSPKVMIIELADTHPEFTATASQDAELTALISQSGYTIVFKDRVNTMFVRNDMWRHALNI